MALLERAAREIDMIRLPHPAPPVGIAEAGQSGEHMDQAERRDADRAPIGPCEPLRRRIFARE